MVSAEEVLRAELAKHSTMVLVHRFGESQKRSVGADPKAAALEAWARKEIAAELARRIAPILGAR